MRRLLVGGLTGLFLLTATLVIGCDSKTTQTPKTMELPKEDPQPVGGPKKGDDGKSGGPPGGKTSTDQ